MRIFFKILLTPLVIVFGVLCGIAHVFIDPIDMTTDFWNDTL